MSPFVLPVAAAILSLSLAGPSRADSAREIGWGDLLPPALIEAEREAFALGNSLNERPADEQEAYLQVRRERTARRKLSAGLVSEGELSLLERDALAARASETHPEAVTFWETLDARRASIERLRRQLDPALEGQRVRIPGYALPLEFDGTAVRQFLLVPYVGACIHTPPPPPNQIVIVEPAEPFESEGLFAPVWVEGTLSAGGGQRELYLVDGSATLDIGYAMRGASVAPYE